MRGPPRSAQDDGGEGAGARSAQDEGGEGAGARSAQDDGVDEVHKSGIPKKIVEFPPFLFCIAELCTSPHTILGIGVVNDVVRLTWASPAPAWTSTFFRVTVRSFWGASSSSVMVAGDLTATNAKSSRFLPMPRHSSAACSSES